MPLCCPLRLSLVVWRILRILQEHMRLSDFEIGTEFLCGGKRWRCTDIGTRVVIAICPDDYRDKSWLQGPPFAISESVFDENDLEGCAPITGNEARYIFWLMT